MLNFTHVVTDARRVESEDALAAQPNRSAKIQIKSLQGVTVSSFIFELDVCVVECDIEGLQRNWSIAAYERHEGVRQIK